MTGSHNTMTFLKARRWWARPFTRYWRCQEHNVARQVRQGKARLLDIRVRQDKAGKWRFCHGFIDLGKMCSSSLPELLNDHVIAQAGNRVKIRLVFERGSSKEAFYTAIHEIAKTMPQVVRAAIKSPWTDLFNYEWRSVDCYFKPIVTDKPLWKQLRKLWAVLVTTPREYALSHRDDITEHEHATIYFRDFITLD